MQNRLPPRFAGRMFLEQNNKAQSHGYAANQGIYYLRGQLRGQLFKYFRKHEIDEQQPKRDDEQGAAQRLPPIIRVDLGCYQENSQDSQKHHTKNTVWNHLSLPLVVLRHNRLLGFDRLVDALGQQTGKALTCLCVLYLFWVLGSNGLQSRYHLNELIIYKIYSQSIDRVGDMPL